MIRSWRDASGRVSATQSCGPAFRSLEPVRKPERGSSVLALGRQGQAAQRAALQTRGPDVNPWTHIKAEGENQLHKGAHAHVRAHTHTQTTTQHAQINDRNNNILNKREP